MSQLTLELNVLLAGDPDERRGFDSVHENGTGIMSSTGQCGASLST